MPTPLALLLTALVTLLTLPAAADELRTTRQERTALELTLYNRDLALIRDRRRVTLAEGENRLAFADVSAHIRPESARLFGEGVTVVEQNFDFDLLSPQQLLEKYVGRTVGLVRTHPTSDEERYERGTLLSVADGGVVFRIGERIETGGVHSPWRFVFDEIPADLRERPTLSMTLASEADGERELELAYLSGALEWQADYVATLEGDEKSLELTGWVTLTNRSGVDYDGATIQLMAGDVQQVRPKMMMRGALMAEAAPMPQVREEGLFEYHLYTLERPTDLAHNQTKQVLLMQAGGVPLEKEYRLRGRSLQSRGEEELKAEVRVRFANRAPALGRPLPAGLMRFYQRDSGGRLQFIGEERIDHTPEGRELAMTVGHAFDVTATRRQTDYRKLYGDAVERAWRIEVHNAKPVPVTVVLLEPMGGDWEIVESNAEWHREDAATARWELPVPAKGKSLLTYRVRSR